MQDAENQLQINRCVVAFPERNWLQPIYSLSLSIPGVLRIVDKKYPPLATSNTTSKSFQPKGHEGHVDKIIFILDRNQHTVVDAAP